MPDILNNEQGAAALLAGLRAAGLGVYPGPDETDLCVLGEDELIDRYQDVIRANKTVLLEYFERQTVARFAQEEAADIVSGKRFCRGDCPNLVVWRHNWPEPGRRIYWCNPPPAPDGRSRMKRLHWLRYCPEVVLPLFCAGPDCPFFKTEYRPPHCEWVSENGKDWRKESVYDLDICPKTKS